MVLRIFKMIPTNGFVTALERTKFVFGRDCAPDPTGGAYIVHRFSQIPGSAPGHCHLVFFENCVCLLRIL